MATKSPKRLARGINSLISNNHGSEELAGDGRLWVAWETLEASSEQPRKDLDRGLDRLAESLRRHGMMQPIVVTRSGEGKYEILAGERRWRAARKAGLKQVPVVVREGRLAGDERLELALIENIQREDLDAIERAKGCARLMSEYGMTQDAVAERLGYQRSTVANLVRLLELPPEIQGDVSRETLTAGHARALLRLQGEGAQSQAWQEIKRDNLSVRGAEALCAALAKGGREPKHRPRQNKPAWVAELQEKLTRRLCSRAEIKVHARGGGKLILHFQELDELDRLSRELDLPSEVDELLEG